MINHRPRPRFDPGQIVHFKADMPALKLVKHSKGPVRIRAVRWVNTACQSGYLIDVQDLKNARRRWNGYDSDYFEVRE